MHYYIAIVAMLRFNQTAADSIDARITPPMKAQMTQKAMRGKLMLY